MKVLSISTDKNVFKEGSAVKARMVEYASCVEEFHVIVFTPKKREYSHIHEGNLYIHPTRSTMKATYIFDAMRIGKKIVAEQKFAPGNSVVTAQDPFECGFTAWRVAKKSGLSLHLQVHTDFLSRHFKTSLLQRMRVRLASFLLPKADGVRVVSERIADSIAKAKIKFRQPPQILPIRIDAETIERSPKANTQNMFPKFKFIVLMASRLTKEKRIQDGLRAFQKILQQYPFAGLVIIGEGPEKRRLQNLALKLHVRDNVVFLGFRQDVPSFMKSANIFLSTSEYEGYGMSVVEAGLCYCPVIATDAGVSGEILKDNLNSFVCPVGDVNCFYSRIMRLISDNALREILSGRLHSDIRALIPEKEEYIRKFVAGLEEASKRT